MITVWILIALIVLAALKDDICTEILYLLRVDSQEYPVYYGHYENSIDDDPTISGPTVRLLESGGRRPKVPSVSGEGQHKEG